MATLTVNKIKHEINSIFFQHIFLFRLKEVGLVTMVAHMVAITMHHKEIIPIPLIGGATDGNFPNAVIIIIIRPPIFSPRLSQSLRNHNATIGKIVCTQKNIILRTMKYKIN